MQDTVAPTPVAQFQEETSLLPHEQDMDYVTDVSALKITYEILKTNTVFLRNTAEEARVLHSQVFYISAITAPEIVVSQVVQTNALWRQATAPSDKLVFVPLKTDTDSNLTASALLQAQDVHSLVFQPTHLTYQTQ